MTLVATEAIVLHAFDYLESSRIMRLATRELGLVSVLARGARRPKSATGTLDLFTHGVAHIHLRPARDLHTLSGFDMVRGRSSLGAVLARFAAATMLAELVLRFGHEESARELFVPLETGLDRLAQADACEASDMALHTAWQLVAALGFAPAIDECALCHATLVAGAAAPFALRAGGVLCASCASEHGAGRPLPPAARDALREWLQDMPHTLADAAHRRAHQRLLREFLVEHLGDQRPLPAFTAWEKLVHDTGVAP